MTQFAKIEGLPLTQSFATPSSAPAKLLENHDEIYLRGRLTADDGGGALWRRATGFPVWAVSIGGEFWEPKPTFALSARVFGVIPDTDATLGEDGLPVSVTQTDRAAALRAALAYSAQYRIEVIMDFCGPTNVLHLGSNIQLPSYSWLSGINGETIFDPETGDIVTADRTWVRAMASMPLRDSVILGGTTSQRRDIRLENFIVDHNAANRSGGSTGFVKGDAICISRVDGFKGVRLGGINAHRHGLNITSYTNTRSGADYAPPTVTDLATNVTLDECWGAYAGDDAITTHGCDGVWLIEPKGYHARATYAVPNNNANAVEVDDKSKNVRITGGLGINCHGGLIIQGHADAEAPNGIYHDGEFVSVLCNRPYSDRHFGNKWPSDPTGEDDVEDDVDFPQPVSETAFGLRIGTIRVKGLGAIAGGPSSRVALLSSYRNNTYEAFVGYIGDGDFGDVSDKGLITIYGYGRDVTIKAVRLEGDLSAWKYGVRVTSTGGVPDEDHQVWLGNVEFPDIGPKEAVHCTGGNHLHVERGTLRTVDGDFGICRTTDNPRYKLTVGPPEGFTIEGYDVPYRNAGVVYPKVVSEEGRRRLLKGPNTDRWGARSALLANIQRRGASDDNSVQSFDVDPVNDHFYTLHEASGTTGVVSRGPWTEGGPICIAATSAMDASSLIGHQGLAVWTRADGTTKLLLTSRANSRNMLVGDYNPGGAFSSDGTWQLFDASLVARNCCPKLAANGRWLWARAGLANGDDVFRAWPASILDEGPGDYRDRYVFEVIAPVADRGDRPVQGYWFDGEQLHVIAGYGEMGHDADQATTIYTYSIDGVLLGAMSAPFDVDATRDAAGGTGNNEPEDIVGIPCDDGVVRPAVLMSNGPTGYRNARLYGMAQRKTPSAETCVARLQAAIMAVDPTQRLTYAQQGVMLGWYRDMITDGLLQKAGLIYATCGRNIGLGELFSRMNLVNPGEATLTRQGSTTDPFVNGYYQGNGTDDCLRTNVPWDFLPAYLRKRGSLLVYTPLNQAVDGNIVGSNPGGSGYTAFNPRKADGNRLHRSQNTTDALTAGVTDSRGLWGLIRREEAGYVVHHDGVEVEAETAATTGPPGASDLILGGSASTFTTRAAALLAVMEELTDAESLKMAARTADLMAALRVAA